MLIIKFLIMLPYEAKISLLCFLSPTLIGFIAPFSYVTSEELLIDVNSIIWWIFISFSVFIYLIITIVLHGYAFQVGVRAAFLGLIFTAGILVVEYLPDMWTSLGWYMCVMAFFHYSEFLAIAMTNPKTLSIDSFVLNHSNEYHIAAVASWMEFFVELYFIPEIKLMRLVSYAGLCLCLGGEMMRKLAMLTAQNSFNHVVQNVKHDDHKLVTHGVYSLCRHPSYVGWFYWSMGTQLILVNPFCLIAYILASWKFFNERIAVEEITLLNFFGYDYVDYQSKVSTGLPFIKGYRLED